MIAPVPRSPADGLKTGPCGNVPRTNTPTQLTAGQVLNVQWQETINHPGYYVWDISLANDVDFQPLVTIIDNQNGGGMHNFAGTLTIPNQPCAACTLRLRQFMTENPAAPTLYFSCADISIAAV
jgi:hypothetical protein